MGRAENQPGVSPAANCDAISLSTAAELVRASETSEEGRAVWRTWRMELLEGGVSDLFSCFGSATWVRTYRSWAETAAAMAGRAMIEYFILTVLFGVESSVLGK